LKFMIDTGFTCSLVDTSAAKRLRLRQEPGESTVRAFARVTKAKRFYLPGLRLQRGQGGGFDRRPGKDRKAGVHPREEVVRQ
jgi:hypothetical protein